jgi:sugar/nucleoside kinase (ribokinase family)
MNYWIEGHREKLLELLGRIDCLMLNDSEARELSGDYNLTRAARWIRERGPRIVVVKKGEHGALLFTDDHTFFAPGYPLEEVFDPTGAGDSFAGGFMGWLAHAGSFGEDELRRAMIYGSATGSLVCEKMGVERLRELDLEEVHERVREFRRMTVFEHPVATTHG